MNDTPKTLDDLPLEVIGKAIARVKAKKYIAICEALTNSTSKRSRPGKPVAGAKTKSR